MSASQIEVIFRRIESSDETRVMKKGKFEIVHIGGLTVGRATYEPEWRWSEHVGATVVGCLLVAAAQIAPLLASADNRIEIEL